MMGRPASMVVATGFKSGYPPIPDNISSIIGPAFFGALFNWCLLGAFIVQTYVYALNFPNDRRAIKAIVYLLLFLELLQTGLQTYTVTQWYVIGWGDIRVATSWYLDGFDSPVMDAIIASIVSSFYCWRIWLFGRSKLLSSSIILLSLVQLVAGIICGYNSSMVLKNVVAIERSKFQHVMAGVWLVASSVCDILIAISMTHLLLREKPMSWRMSNFLVRFIRLTIETNALTASVAAYTVITFHTAEEIGAPIFVIGGMTLGKFYSNTLLVMLNSRIYINFEGTSVGPSTVGETRLFGNGLPMFPEQNVNFLRSNSVALAHVFDPTRPPSRRRSGQENVACVSETLKRSGEVL